MPRPRKVRPVPPAEAATYTDDDLKQAMLNDLFINSNFRARFKDDLVTCMRCWEILRTDKDFYHLYSDVIQMKLTGMEEELIVGKDLENLHLKVDALGNQDVAPGYLRLAEIRTNRLKWILEKRNEKYSSKITEGSAVDGAKVVVVIPKREDDTSLGAPEEPA